MGSIYSPRKKEVQPNTNLHRFLHRGETMPCRITIILSQALKKFNKLNGGKIFSKIDLSAAYLQIEVFQIVLYQHP